jgi:hypothetical protein
MREKIIIVTGPKSHPSCAVDQARESTPEPMTAVIMCALAVHTVPEINKMKLQGFCNYLLLLNKSLSLELSFVCFYISFF